MSAIRSAPKMSQRVLPGSRRPVGPLRSPQKANSWSVAFPDKSRISIADVRLAPYLKRRRPFQEIFFVFLRAGTQWSHGRVTQPSRPNAVESPGACLPQARRTPPVFEGCGIRRSVARTVPAGDPLQIPSRVHRDGVKWSRYVLPIPRTSLCNSVTKFI